LNLEHHTTRTRDNVVVGTLGKLSAIARFFQRYFGIRAREYLLALEFHAYSVGEDRHRVDVYLRGGRERGESCLFSLEDHSENAVLTQARALYRACRLYYLDRIQGRRVLSPTSSISTKGLDSLELIVTASMLAGQNCIPCTVTPEIYVPYARPKKVPPTRFVLDFHQKVSMSLHKPEYYLLVNQDVDKPYAWLSVGRTQGLVANLTNMIRDRSDISVDPTTLTIAILRNLYRHGYRRDMKIPVQEPELGVILGMHVPWQSSGGIVLAPPLTIKTSIGSIHYGPRGTKEQHFATEAVRLRELVIKVTEAGFDYEKVRFPILPNALSEKVELRFGDEDPEKVRVIFMVCLLKVMIDRIVHAPFVHFTRFRGSNGIGTKWAAADAHRYAKMFHVFDRSGRKRKFCDGDIRKLDQSIKAKIIIIFCIMSLLAYDQSSEWYPLMEVFVAFSAETTSRKFVRWIDGLYRYLMTCLFSGEYTTSQLDTFNVDVAFETFCQHVYAEIKREDPKLAKAFWHDLAIREILWIIYGDDFIFTVPEEYYKWFNLLTLNSFLKTYWDTELKLSACHTCESFFKHCRRG